MSPRAICVAILSLQAAYSMALVPATPALLGRDPVVLEALQGSLAAMAAGGAFARVGEASLALALLAPLPTLMMADPFVWWAGRLWGPKIARYLGGGGRFGGRRTDRAVGLLDRYGAWAVIVSRVLPVPSAVIYAAAGWNGMRLRRSFCSTSREPRCGSCRSSGSATRSGIPRSISRARSLTTASCSGSPSAWRRLASWPPAGLRDGSRRSEIPCWYGASQANQGGWEVRPAEIAPRARR
jgi:hypothetical protein